MKLGQEYKQGLVIQRSEKGSAFQEVVDATIGEEGVIEAQYDGGIKKVTVKTSEKSGEPVVVEELPEATEELAGLVYEYNDTIYICEEVATDTYGWVEQVDKGSELGNPLVYETFDDFPEPSADYAGKFARTNDMVIHYYLCNLHDVTQEYVWFELQVIVPED